MSSTTIGLVHPGEMGAALGAALRAVGHDVTWASAGRSDATSERAREADLRDVESVGELANEAALIVSVCPPHAALEVARLFSGFEGAYVDANAISPETTRRVGAALSRYVDGGVIGPPPRGPGTTRLYLSGADAQEVAELFTGTVVDACVLSAEIGDASALKMVYAGWTKGTAELFTGTVVDARVLSAEIGDASALKMVYAGWTKGTAALLLALRAVARADRVEDALLREWNESLPDLAARLASAEQSAAKKGWRWVGEMEEIAATFEAAGQPPGFHRAAAEVFREFP